VDILLLREIMADPAHPQVLEEEGEALVVLELKVLLELD
jgi:hypothetical protein